LNTSVSLGEWLTRSTIWLALLLYLSSELMKRLQREQPSSVAARWLNSVGCVAFLLHVACAFQFYHHWSHSAAYVETARYTEALVGWNFRAGLFVNYVFGFVWLGEVIWSWIGLDGYLRRTSSITLLVRGFFFFMILNGAFVFVKGPMQWLGLALCIALIVCWWPVRKPVDLPGPSRPA
jgi:hypothetical protein